MDFKNYLKENAQKVNEMLDEILLDFTSQTKKTNSKLLPFVLGLINSCKGGKRIRGVSCKLGYEIATAHLRGELKQSARSHLGGEVWKVGATYELLHAALLIHDDIIDQSPKRRGQPSLYQALGGNHYGISQAITLGDIGLYLPIKIITETSFLPKLKLKAINYFSQILINTAWGQIMDVEKDKDIEFINLFKTAKYTIAGPLQIGAILAGANDGLVKKLGAFGENLGIAYQIQDNILDGEVASFSDARSQVLEYTVKAKKMIPQITHDKVIGKLLESMAEYLVERDK